MDARRATPAAAPLFLGDIACPAGLAPRVEGLTTWPGDFSVVNLEGSLRAGRGPTRRRVALYNSPDLIPVLQSWNVRVAGLANNHAFDFDDGLAETRERLAAAGIVSCGAGANLDEAAAPAEFRAGEDEFLFLAFGWEAIECQAAGVDRPGVNPLRPAHALTTVRQARRGHPAARIVVLVHWDYELERFPMPAHRQLAFDLVAAGASAVIGHHPHCVQGIEWRGDAPIVYSLGNGFLPQGDWFGGRIVYPDYAARQLAFEWRPREASGVCHWFDYRRNGQVLAYGGSESARDGETVGELTPFADMPHGDYVSWFRRHRQRRRGLPVYSDYRRAKTNSALDRWVALRLRLVRALRRE